MKTIKKEEFAEWERLDKEVGAVISEILRSELRKILKRKLRKYEGIVSSWNVYTDPNNGNRRLVINYDATSGGEYDWLEVPYKELEKRLK